MATAVAKEAVSFPSGASGLRSSGRTQAAAASRDTINTCAAALNISSGCNSSCTARANAEISASSSRCSFSSRARRRSAVTSRATPRAPATRPYSSRMGRTDAIRQAGSPVSLLTQTSFSVRSSRAAKKSVSSSASCGSSARPAGAAPFSASGRYPTAPPGLTKEKRSFMSTSHTKSPQHSTRSR